MGDPAPSPAPREHLRLAVQRSWESGAGLFTANALQEPAAAPGEEATAAAFERGRRLDAARAVEVTCERFAACGDTSSPRLSRRGRELLALVASDLTYGEIGHQMFISIGTVRSHLDRIREERGGAGGARRYPRLGPALVLQWKP